MKKVFAVLMALVLVFSMGVTAFADGDGTIKITNTVKDAEYTIYKMLNFTPADQGDGGIYKIADGWEGFFNQAPATNYFEVVTTAGETTVILKKDAEGNPVSVDQTLAKAAIAYAKDNSDTIDPAKDAVKVTADNQVVEFTNLDLGYYAIDSTLGTLCALTNTNSSFTMAEKNEKPDITKQVQEDSTKAWGDVNDDDIGKTIYYKSEMYIGLGATNYVMHDTMSAGLTFNTGSVVVTKADGQPAVKDVDYEVVLKPDDGHTFDVVFTDKFIEDNAKTTVTITYDAVLNANAVIAGAGNPNTLYLSYNEEGAWSSTPVTVTTYTWKMDVFKYTPDGDNKTPLAGAEFELTLNGTAIKFTKNAAGQYVVDPNGTIASIITDETGVFEIVGLDADNYALNEIAAPKGYNKLDGALPIAITTYTTDEGQYTYKINNEAPATIEVENLNGELLPETGGIGTTIFYVVGGLMMAMALVVLVSKKRMSNFA